jgi:hypothetical protein
MTAWARLTWQAKDPAALAADLERRLGQGAAVRRGLGGERVIRMGGGDVHIVPWRVEAADDTPRPEGRLLFEPVDPGGDGLAVEDDAERGPAEVLLAAPQFRLAGVGWATVELDRAAVELDPWLEPTAPGPDHPDGQDRHLGARTRIRRSPGLPGEALVLAEPVTEGRLAAALARDGEGPCVLYLEPAESLQAWRAAASSRGISTSAIRPGPLGPSVLVAGMRSGPHLVVIARHGG